MSETYADAAHHKPASDNVVVDGPESLPTDSSAQPQAPAAAPEKEHPYTLKTLKEHGKRGDLWMLLHGKVYDVTKFMDEHPGGDEVLIEEAGRDASEAFEDVGHSDEARAMLDKMFLGDFHGETKEKKVKTATATSSSASSGGVSYLIPVVVLVAAYLGWRVFLA